MFFSTSSQLAMSTHWSCYCLFSVYVVMHFCNNMWSFYE